jgi:Flp pilus assembly protein TadG
MILAPRDTTRRSAIAASELAVVLPALFLIVLGCIDFGRFGYTYVALVNSARAGAEYAITTPYLSSQQSTWEAAVQQKARDEMYQQTGYDSNDLTTSTTPTNEGAGLRRVRVVATYASFETLIPWPGIPSAVTMRAAVVMRVIR